MMKTVPGLIDSSFLQVISVFWLILSLVSTLFDVWKHYYKAMNYIGIRFMLRMFTLTSIIYACDLQHWSRGGGRRRCRKCLLCFISLCYRCQGLRTLEHDMRMQFV
jgi:hypothetical protein